MSSGIPNISICPSEDINYEIPPSYEEAIVDIISESKIINQQNFEKIYIKFKERVIEKSSLKHIIEYIEKNPTINKHLILISKNNKDIEKYCKRYNKETNGLKLKYDKNHLFLSSHLVYLIDKKFVLFNDKL